MKHLTIIVPNGPHNLSSIVGAYKIFTKANGYWERLGKATQFKIQLAGLSKTVNLHDDLFTIKPHMLIQQIDKTDLIIIPSLNHDFERAIPQNLAIISWLQEQHTKGSSIASICTGAFLLAATGLLKGKTCSTHWIAAEKFKHMFPEVTLLSDQIITDESGIYTNGGAFSFLNLMLYLVEKYYDRATAIYCSKVFQIDIERNSQSPFTIFIGQKGHGDELIQKTQSFIEENCTRQINMETLASEYALSRRNFDRRFKSATGNTPLEYLQRARIEAAKKSLESSSKSINEVMYDVGYMDIKAFRALFRKIAGMSPLAYKEKYNKVNTRGKTTI